MATPYSLILRLKSLGSTALATVGLGNFALVPLAAGLRNKALTGSVASGGGTTPPPVFTSQPSISPTSGASGTTWTATPGTVSNGSITTRAWLLNGTLISTGLTATPSAAGTLTYQEFGTGTGGSASSAVQTATVSAAAQMLSTLTVSPNTGTVGAVFNGTISGATSGSSITLSGPGAAGLTISGATISGTPTAGGAVNLTEALAGATNSPNPTNGAVTVAAAAGNRTSDATNATSDTSTLTSDRA